MNEKERVAGNTTIAPDVLETIVTMTVTETKGVSGLCSNSAAPNGIKLKIANGKVNADIYVILKADVMTTVEVCSKIQKNIARAVKEMVGMEVAKIDIHVEDFDFGDTK